jgi:hypothetical protein
MIEFAVMSRRSESVEQDERRSDDGGEEKGANIIGSGSCRSDVFGSFRLLLRVDLGADLPDLSPVVRERADLAHGDEGLGKVGEELVVGGGVSLGGDVGSGVLVEEQRGVGGEEAPFAGDELVVAHVEGGGRVGVQVDHGSGIAGLALPAQGGRVVGVQRGVGAAVLAAEVVEPRRHRRAPRHADRVRA